jgi:predicted RNA binding protein YcfA (HicA-like mRNA interferase family)
MTTVPALTGRQLISALRDAGFEVIRIKGSHHFLKHTDGRCTTIPVHKGETIGKGLLAQILKDCELTKNDLIGLL